MTTDTARLSLYGARTGEVIWGAFPGKDVGRGVADDYEASYDEAKLKTDFFPGDHTHTNQAGARFNAVAVAEGLQQLRDCQLTQYVVNVAR